MASLIAQYWQIIEKILQDYADLLDSDHLFLLLTRKKAIAP